MVGVKPRHDFAFFCDESGISNNYRFTVVGGLCVPCEAIEKIHKNVADYREIQNMKSELKWVKVSNQKFKEYSQLVEYFFAMNNINQFHYHSLIFDNHTWNHKYNGGDRDRGISKLYYQLIHHRFSKYYAKHGSLFVCLDHRHSSTSLNDLRDMLNAGCAKDHGVTGNPIKELISADSHKETMLQINDVILGAICAVKNGKHILATTRQAKRDLGALVLEKSGLPSFDVNTPSNQIRFTVWNFVSKSVSPSPIHLRPKATA